MIRFVAEQSLVQITPLQSVVLSCEQVPGASEFAGNSSLSDRSLSGRLISLKNLADSRARRLLNHVEQPVAFDGHIKVWAGGLSFANAFSHRHVELGNVERKPLRDRRWNPAIALRHREIRERLARLRTAHSELGDLYVSHLARVNCPLSTG